MGEIMIPLPLNITSLGIGCDKMADYFHIYFFSQHNMRKLYLADDSLTENISEALVSDDMSFIANELSELLKDKEFIDYLEKEMVF